MFPAGGRCATRWCTKGRSTRPARCRWPARSCWRSAPPMTRAWCIATSSRPTSCLTRQGEAKLADFGLVRRLEDLAQGGAPAGGDAHLHGTRTFPGHAREHAIRHLRRRRPAVPLPLGTTSRRGRQRRSVDPAPSDAAGPRHPRDRPQDPGRAGRDPAAVPGQVAGRSLSHRGRAGRGAPGLPPPPPRYREPGPRERRGIGLLHPGPPRHLPADPPPAR